MTTNELKGERQVVLLEQHAHDGYLACCSIAFIVSVSPSAMLHCKIKDKTEIQISAVGER